MTTTSPPSTGSNTFSWLAWGCLALAVLLAAGWLTRSVLFSDRSGSPLPSGDEETSVATGPVAADPGAPPPTAFAPVASPTAQGTLDAAPGAGSAQAAGIPVPSRVSLPPPSSRARQTVSQLCLWDAQEPLNADGAAQWKLNFEQLLQGGVDSVSAIAEALRPNTERVFTPEEASLLGYSSARTALLDALARIGGPEATAALGEVLDVAASPREIALVTKSLETLAPGQYTDQAVDAARQTLAMAREKQLEGFDVAPLFEVLQTYGGPGALAELEKASGYWNYYGTVALANLPEAAGVPSLIRMASLNEKGVAGPGRLQALQMLAQLAGANEDARTALLAQAKAGQISPNLWPYLARPLAGEQAHVQDSVLNDNAPNLAMARTSSSHIKHNNQNFYFAPAGGGLTAEEVARQMALIEELSKTTSDPEGLKVLERTRLSLERQAAVPRP